MWNLLSVFLFLCFPKLKLVEARVTLRREAWARHTFMNSEPFFLADAQGDAELTETSRFEES